MTTQWLKLDEACLAADISRSTLYRWINSGLPTQESSTGLRVDADALDRWRSIRAMRKAGLTVNRVRE